MDERLEDTWNPREWPVLREAARLTEIAPIGVGARLHEISDATGLDDDTVFRAVRVLADDGLVDVAWRIPPRGSRVTQISGEARRLVGLWPTTETALDRIIDALEAIAEHTDDEDTRTNAQKFRAWLKSGASTVGFGVAQAAITGQLPGQ